MNKILCCLGAVMLVSVVSFFSPKNVEAAINEQLRFYGTLQDTAGTDLAGTYDMVFRFYDAPTGGTLLDTSTHIAANGNPVTVSAGEFSVLLGSGTGNALDGLDFDTASIYVGLTIGADSEMTPRERLAAAPYAFNADTVDGYDANELLRGDATGTIAVNDTDTVLTLTQSGAGDILNLFDGATEMFTVLNGGNIGVGTSSPIHTLSVGGDMIVTGGLYDNSNSAGVSGYVLQSTGSGFGWVATSTLGIGGGGGGSSLFTDGGATTYLTAIGDNLGIGTTTANQKLTVAGNLNFDGDFGISMNNTRYFYADSSAFNIAIGAGAGTSYGPFSTNNVAIGRNAFEFASTSNNVDSVAIGDQAGRNSRGYGVNLIGWQAGYNNTADIVDVLGYQAGYNNSGDNSILSGYRSGYNNDGYHLIALGYDAGLNSTGNYNTMIGAFTGGSNTGAENVIIGNNAGGSNSGDTNNMIGSLAGNVNTGTNNNMLGTQAGSANRGDYNNLIGQLAGSGASGSYNNILGDRAGTQTTGDYNTMIGRNAGRLANATSSHFIGRDSFYGFSGAYNAVNNIGIGERTGYDARSGASNNILIGHQAADNLTTGANNLVIGYDIDLPTASGDEQLVIGNLIYGTGIDGTGLTVSTGNIGIGTSSPDQKLDVIGTIQASNLLGGATTLSTDASGNIIRTPSDKKLKKNITNIDGEAALDIVLELQGVRYDWEDADRFGSQTEVGFIAQDVDKIIPEIVSKGGEYWALNTPNMLAVVVEAVKEMWAVVFANQENIAELRDELHMSQSEVVDLHRRIKALEEESEFKHIESEQSKAEPESQVTPLDNQPESEILTDDESESLEESAANATPAELEETGQDVEQEQEQEPAAKSEVTVEDESVEQPEPEPASPEEAPTN